MRPSHDFVPSAFDTAPLIQLTATYTWNAKNQLTGISKTGLTASFTYDCFGRRTGRTVNGIVISFVCDRLNPDQEEDNTAVTADLLTGQNFVHHTVCE